MKPLTKFYAGVRWGLATPTVILVALALEDLVVVEEFYKEGALLDATILEAQRLRDKYRIAKFFCDPSEPRFIEKFRRSYLRAVAVEDEEKAGIALIDEYLRHTKAHEPGGIIIKPECKNLGIEFQRYGTKPRDPQKEYKDRPERVFNFAVDALRFLVLGLSYEPEIKVRWI